MGLVVPAWVIGVVGISGIVYVIINTFFCRRKGVKQPPAISLDKNAVQSVINDTYFLYNETGLFVKHCFVAAREDSMEKSTELNKRFDDFNQTIKGRLAIVPNALELSVKVFRLFDILWEYKRDAEIIVSATKNDNRYRDQLKLVQRFANEVAVLYSEIEVELMKLTNEPPNKSVQ